MHSLSCYQFENFLEDMREAPDNLARTGEKEKI